MTKIRKQKRRKHYQHGVNRKRSNKKKMPTIACNIVKKVWDPKKSGQKNMKAMGLVFDINKDVGTSTEEKPIEPKTELIGKLEEEAHAPRARCYRLPKTQVEYLSYLLDKYGEDYVAMAKDHRNHLQQTWKQLRAKINVFKGVPEQFNEYLKSRENKT